MADLRTTLGRWRKRIDWKTVGINLLLVFLSISTAVAGFEGALRLDLVDHDVAIDEFEYRWCEGPHDRVAFHERYGWLERPGSQYLEKRAPSLLGHLGVTVETWNLYTHDSEGFRDTYDTGENEVIVLGDSFTRGTLADDNSTYPHLLDRWSPNTSFRNTGTGGYGTAQELLVYRDMAEEHPDHDLVILGYYLGNDLNDNVARHGGQSPRFAMTDRGLVQTHRPQRQIETPWLRVAHDYLDDRSYAYAYTTDTVSALLTDERPVRTHEPVTGETLDRRLELTRALVDAIRREDRGTDLLVIVIPPKQATNQDDTEGTAFWNAQKGMLETFAANHSDAHVLDLAPALREAKRDGHPEYGDRLYSPNEIHMNERGYRTMARTVHRWLRNNSYVEDRSVNTTRDYDADTVTCP